MMLTVKQAWDMIAREVLPAAPCTVSLVESLGCVLADDVLSTTDSPPFNKSMMDGYAVLSSDLRASSITLQVIEEVLAGRTPTQTVRVGTATRIMTGSPIPPGADAVVPVEWTALDEAGDSVTIRVERTVSPSLNILPQGESMRVGEVILRAGEEIRAQEIALLAETGHARPNVRQAPTVAILATGDELVDIDQIPGPGQIRNSNAIMLAAQVQQAGAIPQVLGIARDNCEDLRKKILAGLESDFLCLSGGVSAGQVDLVPSELQAAGVEQLFHKVAMKPGKPIWFGKRSAGAGEGTCYVFGLPGNPVSSMVCFELFVRSALRHHQGRIPADPDLLTAKLDVPFENRGDRHTWFPAQVRVVGSELRVKLTGWKGSADLRSTVEANCSVSIPPGNYQWSRDTQVEVLPWGRTLKTR